MSAAQLSFPATQIARIRKIDGVATAAGGLTLNSIHVEGTVPKQSETPTQPRTFEQDQGGSVGPRSINATSLSVSGVDETVKELGAITPGQVAKGRYFRSGNAARRFSTRATPLARASESAKS